MGEAGPRELRAANLAAAYDAQQAELERTGFVANGADGHRLLWELRRRRAPRSFALWCAHVAAVGSPYNYQGQPRLATLTGYCVRTCQRARLWAERRGLIRSLLLMPGEKLRSMRAPVNRPVVVRYVAELQELGRLGASYTPPHRRRRKPSAAELPRTEPGVSSAEIDAVIERLRYTASPPSSPERAPIEPISPSDDAAPIPAIDQTEIDAWDRQTAELERELARGPPPRGS